MAEITHVTETVTPEMAAKYLKQNVHNRKLREFHVRRLAEDMANGRWRETGEAGISFDWNGNMADGQHTCEAVVRSGATIRLRVTRGVDPSDRVAMNSALKQRFSDDLTINGVANATFTEPLLRKILTWEEVAKTNSGAGGLDGYRAGKITRTALMEAWPQYASEAADTMAHVESWSRDWPGNRGVLHFAYWLLIHKTQSNVTTVTDFLERVRFGSSDDDRLLFTRLRRKFAESDNAGFQTYFLIKAWNSWCKGEYNRKFQLPHGGVITNPYPKPYKAR